MSWRISGVAKSITLARRHRRRVLLLRNPEKATLRGQCFRLISCFDAAPLAIRMAVATSPEDSGARSGCRLEFRLHCREGRFVA